MVTRKLIKLLAESADQCHDKAQDEWNKALSKFFAPSFGNII